MKLKFQAFVPQRVIYRDKMVSGHGIKSLEPNNKHNPRMKREVY